jgi:ribosomal protein S18 acetylase RimI-like enzyme
MKVSARLATDRDVPEIGAIASELGDEIRGKADLRVVGCIDDVIVGFVDLRWLELGDSTKIGEVVAYGVLPEARAVGVGEMMVDIVVGECKAAACTGIDAQALPGERETKNFFETFGFTARRLVVHHRL